MIYSYHFLYVFVYRATVLPLYHTSCIPVRKKTFLFLRLTFLAVSPSPHLFHHIFCSRLLLPQISLLSSFYTIFLPPFLCIFRNCLPPFYFFISFFLSFPSSSLGLTGPLGRRRRGRPLQVSPARARGASALYSLAYCPLISRHVISRSVLEAEQKQTDYEI